MTTSVIKHPSDCAKCAICQCRCCINKRTKCSRIKKTFIQSDIQLNGNEHRCLLILVRHGLSQDEVDKRYSGWNDCDLSNVGQEQMHRTGQALRQANFSIDLCFTSVLKRAIKSLFIIQEEMDCLWLPVYNTWRLNDRMLGSLTGFHRDRAEALFGQNQLKEWLSRPELAPPLLEESNSLHPRLNYKYRHIYSIVPSTETLVDIRKRLKPFFYDQLMNNLYLGKNILVITHEDIVKAIIRLINNYKVDEFGSQEIPIGIPIVFEFSSNTNELFHGYYLSSPLLDNDTNDQNRSFPTGLDDGKLNLTKNAIREFSSPNTVAKSSNEKVNVLIQQNLTNTIHASSDINSIPDAVDSGMAIPLNDEQLDQKDPGFALPSTAGIALYELATLDQPNNGIVEDGGAFSDNANITTTLHKKLNKNCCSSKLMASMKKL